MNEHNPKLIKMNKLVFKSKLWILAGTVFFLTYACSSDKEVVTAEDELTQAEVKTILETDDISGIADGIVADVFVNAQNSGKALPGCHEAIYTDTGFSIMFNDCMVEGDVNVNGTLDAVYTSEGETISFNVTFSSFAVDDYVLNGTRSYIFNANAQEGAYSFTVTSEMSVTRPDESVVSENGTKTFGLVVGDTLGTTAFTLEGNWTIQLDGNTFAVEVTTALQGNLGCGYLNSGIMMVSKNGLEVSVDFGDGSCDAEATLTYPDGTVQDISLED